ncbi:TetR/AcrR family transcriptional regulator [Demequina sp.]|uniref:TetR/AcrR family transcriptional regulator n=1 Tax=Demequina sp. TaxID=2050685 RepID=UPI003D145CFC
MERDERRAAILSTAMAIIDEQGHQGLTMRGLARECGLSAPGLMHYFPDMPTLVVAVVQYREERDEELFSAIEPGPGMSRRMVDAMIDNIVARPKAAELFAIVEAQAIDPRHPGHEYFLGRAEAIVTQFAPIVAEEYANPEELIRQILAVADGLQLNWLRDPTAFDLRERWKAIADPLLAAAERCPEG